MDVSHLLDGLNPAQREAVSAPPGHYLVLAGAGSGKTRVLIHRIAWLHEVHGVPAHGILAVTFTNKAAGEMRHRAGALLPAGSRGMWIGTFHGLAHRLLRLHYTEAALPDAARSLGRGSRRRLGMIADRLDSFEPGTEVVPGVMLVDTAGHTPGHVSVMVRSGANEVMIGGDALIHPVFSFERPQWRWGPDVDHDTAAATRIRLLDRLATDKTELLGYHLPWPGLGHVERKAGGYHWVPTRRS